MSQIIPIQKLQINHEEVNSVSARDLHQELNISKDFSNWIKAQIRRAELEENYDFIVFAQKGENPSSGRPGKEYILTLESAKHIAMMSQSKRAKEIRNYFIEVERNYIESLKRGSMDTAKIKEQLTHYLDEKFDTFTETLNDYHLGSKKATFYLQRASSIMDRATDAIQDLPLDKDQLKLMREAVTFRGRDLAEMHNISSESAIPALFIKLNKYFDVDSYHEIPRAKYYHAMSFIHKAQL